MLQHYIAETLRMPKPQVVTTKTGSGSAAAKKANAQVDDDAPAADDAAVVPVGACLLPTCICRLATAERVEASSSAAAKALPALEGFLVVFSGRIQAWLNT